MQCLKQWKVIFFFIPASAIHCFRGGESLRGWVLWTLILFPIRRIVPMPRGWWECRFGLGLLGADANVVALIRPHLKVAPLQFEYVADAKSCHTSKQQCLLQHWDTPGCGGKSLYLVKRQVLFLTSFHSIFSRKSVRFSRNIFSL